ncbi:hypothetical protein B0H11DRAFT_1900378 [Mycena galericulata]|nr:hypothetical protein B0H11DRAFT_1900378 [Mycena galericulata]
MPKYKKIWAEGAREDLLRPHIEAYANAIRQGWRSERDYLQKVTAEYHARISWRLLDHEEPELPLPDYDPLKPAPLEDFTHEERAARRARIEQLNVIYSGSVVGSNVTSEGEESREQFALATSHKECTAAAGHITGVMQDTDQGPRQNHVSKGARLVV